MSARYRVVVIGRDVPKTQIHIQGTRRLHVAERVQQHAVVTRYPRRIENGFSQLPAQTRAAKAFTNIQALHLAGIGVVHGVQRTHRTAACDFAAHHSQQQTTLRRGVVTGQAGKLGVEVLKAQVNARLHSVFLKDGARGIPLSRRDRCDELGGGGRFRHETGRQIKCIDFSPASAGCPGDLQKAGAASELIQYTSPAQTPSTSSAAMREALSSRDGGTGVTSSLSP